MIRALPRLFLTLLLAIALALVVRNVLLHLEPRHGWGCSDWCEGVKR